MERIELDHFLYIAGQVLDLDPKRLARATRIDLAESALAAPFASFGGVDAYPDPHERGAILCSRIVRNHPLPDGNKRVGLVCMREFFLRNQIAWTRPGVDETAEAVENLAARKITEDQWVEWVQARAG